MNRTAVGLLLTFVLGTSAVAQEIGARLDSVMRVAERNGFSGVVLVHLDGQPVLHQGYGLANRAANIPFSTATIVQIGSNTKDFTTAAILQLHEAGRLSIADTLGKFFANAPADKRGITLRQLMNHRGGFPLGVGADFEPLNREALIARAMATPLLFAPGRREGYSNTGYSLLAAVIEQTTGESYDAYVRRAILVPAGMARTGFHLPGFKPEDLAHGYGAAGTDNGTMLARPHASDGPYWNLRGNGGMLSTVGDMHTFYVTLFETEKLMKASTRALHFNAEEPIGLAGSDGVSFFLYDRFPMARSEIIIASTNAAMRAPAIRRELGKVLGLPDPDGPDDSSAPRPGGTKAEGPIAEVLRRLVTAINAGDRAALRAFIGTHFVSGGDAPTVDERLERITRVRENLGTITIESIETFATGPVEMRVVSSLQGPTLIRVELRAGPAPRIVALQVLAR